ncbi:unnamed protein product [Bursaphelenchus xylophilus]|uniref:(pine wood nematode) hypothetical protein n=1 Tax=Bursaphelenchus xylophilus TaxID=6326 RepID=A0A1I7SV90_BURXY|nr:unnamed protein product [Bursaphelenchus xylophilus]CAG9101084.1 unnamed protein product [Bursaphelenchus xylophilus]
MAKAERPHLALDFQEAIKDSPAFRQDLNQNQEYFNSIYKRYAECVNKVDVIVECGQNYVAAIYNFTATLNTLWAELGVDEPKTKQTFDAISDALAQVVSLNKGLIENTFPSFLAHLGSFNQNELSKLRDSRNQFDNMSQALNDSLNKRASISRSCGQALKEARNGLTAVGTCFAHTSLDYVAQINIAHSRKHYVLLEALWLLIKEYIEFFKKGHSVFVEKPDINTDEIADNINMLRTRSKLVERKMQDRHSVVPKDLYEMHSGLPTDPEVAMEGYLFKRSNKAFKTWHRRWFMIKGEKFMYIKKNGEQLQSMVMEDNLKLCLVRPAPSSIERSCCFELVSRSGNHVLQADSEMLCREWIHALQTTIQHLHEGDTLEKPSTFMQSLEVNSLNSSTNQNNSKRSSTTLPNNLSLSQPNPQIQRVSFFEELKRIPGNRQCADCGHSDAKWASINLGVVICIECSGAHRSLGVHVSKVRSLTMDELSNEQKEVLKSLGNQKVNRIYLAGIDQQNLVQNGVKHLTPTSERAERELFITAKYVEKRFVKPLVNKLLINSYGPPRSSSFHEHLFFHANATQPESIDSPSFKRQSITSRNSDSHLDETDANEIEKKAIKLIETGNIEGILDLMANGFDINARLSTNKYPIHVAINSKQNVLIEFLFLNGIHVNVVDADLNSPLHIAAANGNTLGVYQLVKRNADKDLKNAKGETALQLAVEAQHANIVTLLRLQDLRDTDQNDGLESTVDSFMNDLNARKESDEPLS